jgi:hypothetical protein
VAQDKTRADHSMVERRSHRHPMPMQHAAKHDTDRVFCGPRLSAQVSDITRGRDERDMKIVAMNDAKRDIDHVRDEAKCECIDERIDQSVV